MHDDGMAMMEEETFGLYDAECAGCDIYGRVDDIGLCEECSAKLDRDMIRQRDWDYSASAWLCPEDRREELRRQVIAEYGPELELIAPSGPARGKKSRSKKKRKGKGRKARG